MASHPLRISGQLRLRSSCDGCSTAKLKCDRGQPECGRCVSNSIKCIYGVSRKMGKPRRESLRPISIQTPSNQASAKNVGKLDDGSNGDGSSMLDLGPFSSDINMSEAWDPLENNANGLMISLDALDGLYNKLPGPALSDFASLDVGNWFNDSLLSNILQFGPLSTPESLEFESYSPTRAPPAQLSTHQSQAKMSPLPDDTLIPPANITSHDCLREASEILESLSLPNISKALTAFSSETTSASMTGGIVHCVPLDYILRLNREGSERLGGLLNCSCTRSPHLTLLYTSIISRVLFWYHQAAGCTQNASWSPPTVPLDAPSRHLTLNGSSLISDSGSGVGSSTWFNTAPSTFSADSVESTPTSTLNQSTGLAVAPSKWAAGAFNVDDLRVQNALTIQLLSGEMRRASALIDQFSLYNSGSQRPTDESTLAGISSLHQSLDSWLRGEHSRIANVIRSKLRELNT